jgi:hypothetical protein
VPIIWTLMAVGLLVALGGAAVLLWPQYRVVAIR